MARTKLTAEDVSWLESRLSDAVFAEPIQPRREFIDRAKSQLLDSPWPHPPSRWRTISLWSALMFTLSAILVSTWYLRQRALRRAAAATSA